MSEPYIGSVRVYGDEFVEMFTGSGWRRVPMDCGYPVLIAHLNNRIRTLESRVAELEGSLRAAAHIAHEDRR